MSEAEQIVTINKCQVIKYLGRTSKKYMELIDGSIRVSLHLELNVPYPFRSAWNFPDFEIAARMKTESEERYISC